jgi:hypothetical protein
MTDLSTSPSTARSRQPHLKILVDGLIITAQIPVKDWLAFPDHPLHRASSKRLESEHWRFARQAKGAVQHHLQHVVAAVFEGVYYKVDGHVRAHLWGTGELPAPTLLHSTIYRVSSEFELNDLYRVFRTHSRIDKYDEVCTAYQANGLTLTSKRLKHGLVVHALNIALRGAARSNQNKRHSPELDLHKAVGVFREELKVLDTVDPQPEIFLTGVVAAALITLALFPQGIEFYRKLAMRQGNKTSGEMDPIEAALQYVDSIKDKRISRVNRQQEDLCARTLRAFLAWEKSHQCGEEYWFKTRPRAADIAPWIARLKVAKGVEDDPSL